MNCRNCGNPILEGDRFCSKCGTRVAEAPIPLCIPEEEPSRFKGLWKSICKGRKTAVGAGRPGKWISRVIPGIFGAVVVLLIANSAKLINSCHINFSTPEEYYRWVERRAIQKNAKTLAEYYANYYVEYLRGYDSRTSGEIRVELGDAGRAVLEAAGLEPWFEEGTFTYEATRRNGVEQGVLEMEIGGERLFGLDAVMDLRDEAVYLGFPGLTEKYLALDTGGKDFLREFEDVFGMEPEEYLKTMELLEALYKECPDKKQVEVLANRYLGLLLEGVGDVKMRTGKTARAGGVTQTCTTLEIYLDKDDIRNMLSGFLKELREDSEIEALLYQTFELAEELELEEGCYRDADEFYGAFQDKIDEILDDMDYYITYHNELDMTVYVDDKGQIIGRTLEFPNSRDKISVSYLSPRRGSRFGYKASIAADDGEVSVTGAGREFWNKIDGNFTLKYNGSGIVDVEVEDFEPRSLRKGFLNGCFTVKAVSDVRRGGDMGFVQSFLPDLQLILDVSMDRSSRKLGIELREGRELWGALTMTARSGSGKKISVPSTKKAIFVEDSSDFADWWETIEWGKLLKSMDKAGMPSEAIEKAEELREMDLGGAVDALLDLIW